MRGTLVFICAVVGWGTASAAPSMAVTASGACGDSGLMADVKLLTEALRARVGSSLLTSEQVSAKLGAEAAVSLEDLKRQLVAARTQLFQGEPAKAEKALADILAQAERLPPGPERWQLQANALLLGSLVDRERGRVDAADEGFRRVLRADPGFRLDADYFAPTLQRRFEHLRAELAQVRKAPLSVRSNPSGADVYVDGHLAGRTPAALQVRQAVTLLSWHKASSSRCRTW